MCVSRRAPDCCTYYPYVKVVIILDGVEALGPGVSWLIKYARYSYQTAKGFLQGFRTDYAKI